MYVSSLVSFFAGAVAAKLTENALILAAAKLIENALMRAVDRLTENALMRVSRSLLDSRGIPNDLAIALIVTSSCVGPIPPLVMTISCADD